ncbi:MAG: DUF4381 domain-containing protein [Congregibacter sp.]
MNSDIASMLEPLRAPAAVSWWPLAPGWWVLMLLILVAIAFAGFYAWQRYQRGAPLREAKQRLQIIGDATELEPSLRVAALGQLQRQIAIELSDRKVCAGLTGEAWATFLNNLGAEGRRFFTSEHAELGYQKTISERACADAIQTTASWLDSLAVSR